MSDKEERARILEKLRRLMSMTVENGASEAEAMTAAEAAARLMSEHNLSYRTVDEIDAEAFSDDERPWFKGAKGRSRAAPVPPARHCLAAISSLCNVEHSFNFYTGNVAFFGARHDTEVAHYLLVIISRAIEREWSTYRQNLRPCVARQRRASFMHAISYRISGRLMAMHKQNEEVSAASSGRDLVLVKSALVKERFEKAHPELKTVREPKMTDLAAVRAGWAAGANVPLNKGVNEASGSKMLFSEAGMSKP